MASIGENIKKLREEKGLSQAELARLINKTRAAISQYENGDTTPRMGVIEDMASVFGVKKSAIIESHYEYGSVRLWTNDENELVELFRKLDTKAQHALLAGMREYVS